MPRAQAFDVNQFLDDADCDISDESSGILDFSLDIRRKFNVIVGQARQLKAELLAKEKGIADLTSQHQQALSRLRQSADITRDKLRRQNNNLQQCKKANRLLRLRNRELSNDLETMREELEKVSHLRCDICFDSFKNVVTGCGHGFCNECLILWRSMDDNTPGELEKPCPACRQIIKEGDIRKLYLEPGSIPSAAPEDEDKATEVLSVTSDSE